VPSAARRAESAENTGLIAEDAEDAENTGLNALYRNVRNDMPTAIKSVTKTGISLHG
jgi:hypothetical protein